MQAELHPEERAALSRVQQKQVSRARQELTGAELAPKTSDTLVAGEATQVRSMAIPWSLFDKPVELDVALFTKEVRRVLEGARTRCCECAWTTTSCSNSCLVSPRGGCSRDWRTLERGVPPVVRARDAPPVLFHSAALAWRRR